MDDAELAEQYRAYLDCLNARDLDRLDHYVHPEVVHNGHPLGVAGYRAMLARDFAAISDLRYAVELLVVQTPRVAARLAFDCTPVGEFLGLAVDGRRVSFSENVFYRYRDGLVAEVWSVLDRAAVEAQLG